MENWRLTRHIEDRRERDKQHLPNEFVQMDKGRWSGREREEANVTNSYKDIMESLHHSHPEMARHIGEQGLLFEGFINI